MAVDFPFRTALHGADLDALGHDVHSSGLIDLLTGDDSLFMATIGAWVNSGGTLTWSNNSNYAIQGSLGIGSLQFVATADNQYVEIPIAGDFLAGHVYDAFVWIAFEENVFSGTEQWQLSIGLHGTEIAGNSALVAADEYFVDDNGYYLPIFVRWSPTADRTGVTLRLTRSTAAAPPTVTVHVGLARVAEVIGAGLGLQVVPSPSADDQTVYLNASAINIGAFGSFMDWNAEGVRIFDQYGGTSVRLGKAKLTLTGSSGGVVLPKFASAPSSPVEAETYHDTTLHKVRTWDGSAWQNHW